MGLKLQGYRLQLVAMSSLQQLVEEVSNGLVRTTTTTYTINVTGLSPSLTIGSGTQATDAYTSNETRLLASIGTEIPPITIKHDSHSKLRSIQILYQLV